MTAGGVAFPALPRREQRLPDDTSAEAMRAFFATRLSDAEASVASEGASGEELSHLVRAAVRLAMVERLLSRCDRAEAVLSNTLSFLTWLAVEHPELHAARRLCALHAAQWCAEELATLYDDHGRPAHARVVRAACAAIERRSFAPHDRASAGGTEPS